MKTALAWVLSTSLAFAQLGPGAGVPVGPGSGGSGGGGGGSGTVTSVAGGCGSVTTPNPITITGTVFAAEPVNPQTGAGYTLNATDCGGLLTLSNAGAQTLTIPQAGTAGFASNTFFEVCNIGTGTWTLSPTTSTLTGPQSLVTSQCTKLVSDGVNWQESEYALRAATQSAGDNTTLIATDQFVTTAVANAIAGVNPAISVNAATTAAGDTSGCTYANGASGIGATFTCAVNTAVVIDGFTFNATTQSLLVKNDTQAPSGAFNGIYNLTAVQTGITGAIFTRRLDYDTPSDMNNTGAVPVISGTVNGTTSWLLTTTVVTVGTTALSYTQFSINPTTVVTGPLTGDCTTPSAGSAVTRCNSTPFTGFQTNFWYKPYPILEAAGSAVVANTISCFFGGIPQKVTVQGLGVAVTGLAGTNASGAIYANTNSRPGALIGNVGATAFVTSGTGIKTAALSVNKNLGPGGTDGGRDLWFCTNADGAPTFIAVQNGGAAAGSYLVGSTTTSNVLNGVGLVGVACTGANCAGGSSTCCTWPATLVGSTWTEVTNTKIPAMIYEVVP